MCRRRPVLDYLAYLAVRVIVCLGQMMSVAQSYAFARGLAALLYRVDTRHRKVGMENLRLAFGDAYTEAERDAIVRGVYRHFCMMLMEILHIPRKLRPTTWRQHIRLVGHRPILDRLLEGGPVVMVTGHYGNWEMAGYLFGVFGFPPHSVARTLDNPHLEHFLKSFRERTGQRLIPKKGGYDDMLAVLRSGGVLSFLADQDAGARGMFVDFFGRPASTHKAIALLAIEHKAPVIVGSARRIGPGFRYEVACEAILDPTELTGTSDDARLLTQRYTAAIERMIRRDPTQYLWLHRRWKHEPAAKKGAHPAQGSGRLLGPPPTLPSPARGEGFRTVPSPLAGEG